MAHANPLFGPNRLKLGVFGSNGPGITMTRAPQLYRPTWANTVAVARAADEAGLEALVPYARWHPFGPPEHPSGHTFETMTWAAAMAALTQRICVMATCHVPMFHPIVAAKQGMTIDHASGGRFALNIVCGWLKPELDMFGLAVPEPEARYAHAETWVEAVSRLWQQEAPLDLAGAGGIALAQAVAQPKPLQRPRPPLMNAGNSPQGMRFAARHCDIAFVMVREMEAGAIRAQVEDYRALARSFGRTLQVWVHAIVVQDDSRARALAVLEDCVGAQGDEAMAQSFIRWFVPGFAALPAEVQAQVRFGIMAGAGGAPLLGTAHDIASDLAMLSDAGVDGVLLGWVDYLDGIARFNRDVLPLLEHAGLRAPAAWP
ncbi:LLM class flavin-dependent oxidoreductase [Zavarzinia sp. CC-PAN008]|uniref:LLM class flavin-dependent oxidoreductase n=1 Tax=Zavarzinia sp. CC-PAN008 TaxID=3243332 RepID=UPI003F7482CF